VSEIRLRPRGPFRLAAAAEFLAGFAPARAEPEPDDALRLAMVRDDARGAYGVELREDGDEVVGRLAGDADPEAAAAQVARVLSLDHDARGWPAAGRRDPVLGELQAAFPGLRPPLFGTPYEAGAWALLTTRTSMAHAARMSDALRGSAGTALDVRGRILRAFPTPEALLDVGAVPGAPAEKVRRLHALAEATLAGVLDPARLRGLAPDEAMAEIQGIHGVGPFSAELILVRGAGAADHLPRHEPRVRAAAARRYGLPGPPGDADFERLAEPWRPFRAWACFLLRAGA
jgi:DNA-3-methyladenine glycosylase II